MHCHLIAPKHKIGSSTCHIRIALRSSYGKKPVGPNQSNKPQSLTSSSPSATTHRSPPGARTPPCQWASWWWAPAAGFGRPPGSRSAPPWCCWESRSHSLTSALLLLLLLLDHYRLRWTHPEIDIANPTTVRAQLMNIHYGALMSLQRSAWILSSSWILIRPCTVVTLFGDLRWRI